MPARSANDKNEKNSMTCTCCRDGCHALHREQSDTHCSTLTSCACCCPQIWITVVVAVLSSTMSTSAIDSLQVTFCATPAVPNC